MSRTVYFYATKTDLLQLCRDVESEEKVEYTLAGNLKAHQAICYPNAIDIPDLGISQKGALLYEPSYLVVGRGTPIISTSKTG